MGGVRMGDSVRVCLWAVGSSGGDVGVVFIWVSLVDWLAAVGGGCCDCYGYYWGGYNLARWRSLCYRLH